MTNFLAISGNLTADSVLKFSGDKPFLVFSLAHTDSVYDSKTKSYVDGPTSYFDVSISRNAEGLVEVLTKGVPVEVVGKVEIKDTEKDGTKYRNVRIYASSVSTVVKTPKKKEMSQSEEPGW